MSRHKHPQSRSNRQSPWDKGNGYLRQSAPQLPGERVVWQTKTGKRFGALASPIKLLDGSMYCVIEDGQTEVSLVRYVRKENPIIG